MNGAQLRTTTQKGLGWTHQKRRAALLSKHRDGTRCWWCGEPMYRDAARNPDGRTLHADHTITRSQGGKLADRLLHNHCNVQRGNGSRDNQRPALALANGGCPRNSLDWG